MRNIVPGADVTVEVAYSPLDEGTDGGTLVIGSNDIDEADVIVSLYGNGVTGSGVIEVDIDIMPGSPKNSINLKGKGVIPVAILTTDTFDATVVDPMPVEFGPDGAIEAHGTGHIEDIDGDGDFDLLLHFNTRDTGIACEDTAASITGETFNGQLIEGFDAIRIVGCE